MRTSAVLGEDSSPIAAPNRVIRVSIYLVRHGSAGRRNDQDNGDTARHLDEVGLRQALQISEILSDSAITEVRSSPAARCVETVSPTAQHHRCTVHLEDALFEGSDIDAAWKILEDLARARVNAVLCSHGDLIPELIRRAKGRGMEVPGKSGSSKGSIWTLQWNDGGFDRGSYQPVPG